MALHIPYHRNTFRPTFKNDSDSEKPVEFDLAPPEGPDIARVKSMVFGSMGLTDAADWSPATQDAVIAALEKGRAAFLHTVEAVRNLSVPAVLARRVGLDVPEGVSADAPVPVRTGPEFARVCGFVPTLAFLVAMEIVKLSNKTEIDLRFFDSPSGSGSPGTRAATPSTARSARNTSRRRGTAGAKSRG